MTQIYIHTYFEAKINLHANNISKMSTLKFVFHFTISLVSGNILIYVTLDKGVKATVRSDIQ